MASVTVGSAYVVSDEGVDALIELAERDSVPTSRGFVSHRATADRLATLAARHGFTRREA
jgi:hypothetical protein